MGGRRDFRWGDAAEEDDGIEGVLPPTQVIGPDEKGVKIIIEWRKNEEGVRTKVTKTVRVKKQVWHCTKSLLCVKIGFFIFRVDIRVFFIFVIRPQLRLNRGVRAFFLFMMRP